MFRCVIILEANEIFYSYWDKSEQNFHYVQNTKTKYFNNNILRFIVNVDILKYKLILVQNILLLFLYEIYKNVSRFLN